MPRYRYKAVSASGEVLEGELDAPDEAAAIQQMRDLNYLPVRADEIGARSAGRWLSRTLFEMRRVTPRHLGVLTC